MFRNLTGVTGETIPYELYFTPNNDNTQNIVKICAKNLKLSGSRGFESEAEMINHFDAKKVFAGIVLNGSNFTLRFPNYFRTQYKKKAYRMPDFWLTRCSGYDELDKLNHLKHVDFYAREGFLQLYDHLLKAYYKYKDISIDNTKQVYENNSMIIRSVFPGVEPQMGCVGDIDRRGLTAEGFLNSALYSFIYFVPFLNLVWVSDTNTI